LIIACGAGLPSIGIVFLALEALKISNTRVIILRLLKKSH